MSTALFHRCLYLFLVFRISTSLNVIVEQTTTPNAVSSTDFDVIQLNVGGQFMATTRSTLTCMPRSVMAVLFNGQWDEKFNRDQRGLIYLDLNPTLFGHLLEQLRFCENKESMRFFPPSTASLILPFEKMLRKLNFDTVFIVKDVRRINVGGETLTARTESFEETFNLTRDYFLDMNPKHFHLFVDQQREKSESSTETTASSPMPITDAYKDGICANATWNTEGITVAGGHGQGDNIYQLDHPMGLFVDINSSIYIADTYNHRIVKWSAGASYGEILIHENQTQNFVSKVVVNNKNGTLYYCDRFHHRVRRWSNHQIETIISNISCWGLALDQQGSLYISIQEDHQVFKYPEQQIVAGGHGEGSDSDQFSSPHQIFVDHNQTVYIADYFNHRVTKWFDDFEEGIVVAGGQGFGNGTDQLKLPHSIAVDQMETMYIVDFGNDRILRWFKHSKTGNVLIGNDNFTNKSSRLADPYDIAFDRHGNVYVADTSNHRIQMYQIDKSACTTTTDTNEQYSKFQ